MIHRLQSLLGANAVTPGHAGGIPRVAPHDEEECALLLGEATAEGWRVRIEGGGTWNPLDAPADIALTTRRMNVRVAVSPADLVATVSAGVSWDDLRTQLAEHGVWIPADPPGGDRTVGSIVATATTGSLRTGFGPIRGHVLGLTLVTGDGRIIRVGGKVVKNVAGFDLAKLAAGSFGAFGVVTSVHFRLRSVPRADTTLVVNGKRHSLIKTALNIAAEHITPAALEVVSPTAGNHGEWTLAVRIVGSDAGVREQKAAIAAAARPSSLNTLSATDASLFWQSLRTRAMDAPTTIRCGTVPSGLGEALDTVQHHLDENSEDWITVATLSGMVRWSGRVTAERIKLFRYVAAQREIPVTLERADWNVRSAVGHFGAYREGVGRLVSALRRTLDPASVLVVPIDDHT